MWCLTRSPPGSPLPRPLVAPHLVLPPGDLRAVGQPSPGGSGASLRLAPAGSPWEGMSSELHFPPLQEELISIARRRLQQRHLYWGGSGRTGLLSPLPRAPVISYQTGLRWQGTQSRHVWESRARIPHQEAEPRWDWWSPGTLRRRLRVSFPLCPLTRFSA